MEIYLIIYFFKYVILVQKNIQVENSVLIKMYEILFGNVKNLIFFG